MLRIPRKCHLLLRFHRPMLVSALAATVVGVYFSSKLGLESDLASLLPHSSPSVQALERMKEEIGGIGQLRLVLESDSFPALRQLAQDLSPKLEASPYVGYVDYQNDVAFYQRNALLFLDTAQLDSLHVAIQSTVDKEKQRLNPLLVEDLFTDSEPDSGGDDLAKWEEEYSSAEPKPYYVNADSTVLVMKVFASTSSSDLSFDRAMVSDVRRIVAGVDLSRYDPDLKVYYGGNVQNRIDEFATVKHDILGTAVLGVSGVLLIIVLYFHSVLGALLVGACLLASLSWTFGVTYLVIGKLNTITGFLFVILFGLGVDYGIHAWSRYIESRRAGLKLEDAIERMVCGTGTALMTTAVTTAAAFFSLLIMKFKGFSDLGFIAGVGILFAFVAMVFVLPALAILVEKLGWLRVRLASEESLVVRRTRFRHAGRILALASVTVAASAYLFTRVGFEFDFTNLRAMTHEREVVSEKTRGVFSLSDSPAVVIGDSRRDVAEIVAAVEKKIAEDSISPTIASVRSVFSLVPSDQPQRLERIREIRNLVRDEAEGVVTGDAKRRLDKLNGYLQVDRPFTWDDFPTSAKRQFINKRGEIGNFVLIYPSVALRDGRNGIEFRKDVGTIVTASGKEFHAASVSIIGAEMLQLISREGWMAGGLAFVVVFLAVMADFRTIKAAVLVLSPLAIGVLWMGGLMYLFGMKLNFFNIVVLPSIIGIGVDSGVHIYHRYLEEGAGSLYFVLRRTGLTIGVTTLTTIVGYSGLIVARHPGLRSMGYLAVLGLVTTFLAAVVVLPALVHVIEERELEFDE